MICASWSNLIMHNDKEENAEFSFFDALSIIQFYFELPLAFYKIFRYSVPLLIEMLEDASE